jgi:Mg2+/Co2+ transporter CorB
MKTKITGVNADDDIKEIVQNFSDTRYTLLRVFEGSELVAVINMENIEEFIQVQEALKEQPILA